MTPSIWAPERRDVVVGKLLDYLSDLDYDAVNFAHVARDAVDLAAGQVLLEEEFISFIARVLWQHGARPLGFTIPMYDEADRVDVEQIASVEDATRSIMEAYRRAERPLRADWLILQMT